MTNMKNMQVWRLLLKSPTLSHTYYTQIETQMQTNANWVIFYTSKRSLYIKTIILFFNFLLVSYYKIKVFEGGPLSSLIYQVCLIFTFSFIRFLFFLADIFVIWVLCILIPIGFMWYKVMDLLGYELRIWFGFNLNL